MNGQFFRFLQIYVFYRCTLGQRLALLSHFSFSSSPSELVGFQSAKTERSCPVLTARIKASRNEISLFTPATLPRHSSAYRFKGAFTLESHFSIVQYCTFNKSSPSLTYKFSNKRKDTYLQIYSSIQKVDSISYRKKWNRFVKCTFPL